MTHNDGTASRGEMRRRHEEIIRSGALAKLRSEGRLVLTLALCWADYKTCQFRMSVRGAATVAGVQPTAVRRGIRQLVDAGVIEAGPFETGKRQRYRFRTPQKSAHEPCPGGAHSVSSTRAHTVSTTDTHGVQRAHPRCPDRAPTVSCARTGCAPYSSIVLKGSSRTREDENVLTGGSVPDGPDRLDDSSETRTEAAT